MKWIAKKTQAIIMYPLRSCFCSRSESEKSLNLYLLFCIIAVKIEIFDLALISHQHSLDEVDRHCIYFQAISDISIASCSAPCPFIYFLSLKQYLVHKGPAFIPFTRMPIGESGDRNDRNPDFTGEKFLTERDGNIIFFKP